MKKTMKRTQRSIHPPLDRVAKAQRDLISFPFEVLAVVGAAARFVVKGNEPKRREA